MSSNIIEKYIFLADFYKVSKGEIHDMSYEFYKKYLTWGAKLQPLTKFRLKRINKILND